MKPGPRADEPSFRDVRARLAAAVVVLACRSRAGLRAMTVTTFSAASLEPPMVLASLDVHTAAREAIVETGRFAASILGSDQQFLADRFAGQGPAPDAGWSGIPHSVLEGGLPVLAGCGWLLCQVVDVTRAGDHDVVLAAVESWGRGEGEPLVYWERDYWTLAPT